MLTKEMGEHLAALAHLLRADLANRSGCSTWDEAGIFRQLGEVARFPAIDTCLAVLRASVDAGAETPGVIPALDGPHWIERLSQQTAPRNPLPHEECPEHPGQYRLSCSFRPPCGPARGPRPERTAGVRAPDLDQLRDQLHKAAEPFAAREIGDDVPTKETHP